MYILIKLYLVCQKIPHAHIEYELDQGSRAGFSDMFMNAIPPFRYAWMLRIRIVVTGSNQPTKIPVAAVVLEMYGPPSDCKEKVKIGSIDRSAQMYSPFVWRVGSNHFAGAVPLCEAW